MEENKDETPKEPLSRRDFLRRAGKDVAEKGLEMTPANIATRTILGDEKKGQDPIWTRFAAWRKSKETDIASKEEQKESTEEQKDAKNKDSKSNEQER